MADKLSDKIWKTRKTRIYTEKRLKIKAFISESLIIEYSFFLLALSLWNYLYPNKELPVYLIVSSTAVLICSIFLYAQRYTERALSMRNCYIQLDKLHSKVPRTESNPDIYTIENLESEYANLLSNVENHSDYDYLCFRYTVRNVTDTNLPDFSSGDYIEYIFGKAWRAVIIAFLFLLPLFILLAHYSFSYVGV